MDVAAKLQWEAGWWMLYSAVSSMEDISTNHRNNRMITRTLRPYLDPGFAKGVLGHTEVEVWDCGEKYCMESANVDVLDWI